MTSDLEPTASIFEQAAHWWELLDGESASNTDHREFNDWVAKSPERVAAFLRTAQLVKATRSSRVKWPRTSPDVLIRDAKATRERVLPFSAAQVASPGAGRERRYLGSRIAWAAAAVLLLSVGLSVSMLESAKEITTALGEQRSILLPDGSRVTLNTASTVEVKMHKSRREVRLVQGEALFEVAHDAARPFVVRAGSAVLKDMGTLFNVDLRSSATTVTVVEGKVDVESATAESGGTRGQHAVGEANATLVLEANELVVVTPAGVGLPQRKVNVAASVAWTQRQLMFEHRPLSEVAEEFNRYNKDRIEIDNSELKRQEVTGVFEAKDPGSFVAFLSNIPGVEIREGANGSHIVTIRKPQKVHSNERQ